MAIGTSKPPSKSAPFVADKDGYTRLHIAPLDPELIGIVLSSSVRPLARNISYHSIETFPERRYGFVEVPQAEAEKLRKKLNGATLRGSKMRIEQAKPESIPPPTGAVADEDVKVKKSHKKEKKEKKKRKRGEPEVLDGVVLSDRKIKRGWTVSEGEMIKEKRKDKDRNKSVKEKKEKKDKKDKKEKRSAEKSKYTDAPECLFKQKMPEIPSAQPPAAEDEEEDGPRRKKKKRSNREVVVHEFERSTKYPSFLRAAVDETKKAEPLEFEDGKGWVDAAGNVVEPLKVTKVPELPKPKKGVPEWPMPKKYEPKPVPEEDDATSSSGSSSDSEAEEPAKPQKVVQKQVAKPEEEDDTSSSDSSSESDSDEDSDGESSPSKVRTHAKNLRVDTQGAASSPSSGLKLDSSRPKSSGSVTSLTIKIPPPTTPASSKAVHPLEALYKRKEGANETGAASDAQPFSFFNNDDDDIEEEAAPAQAPMTPYSKQDFEFRATRSAAPTPDTAHPSRSYLPWSTQEDDLAEEDEEDEIEADGEDLEDADGDMAMAGAAADGDQSKASAATDFQKFFWENRGDLNRKWKKRRKTALKERRNRENRARAARAI